MWQLNLKFCSGIPTLGLPSILNQTRGLISWKWWLPLGCIHLRPWLCARQRSVRDLLPHVYTQRCFPNTHHETVPNWPWKKPSGRDHSLVVSLPPMVGSKSVWDNGHCHGYRVGPPTHFSEQVLAWRWSDLSLTLACSHAGLEVSYRCGFRHWEYTDCVYQWISQWFHPGCQHHDCPTCSCVHWSHPW